MGTIINIDSGIRSVVQAALDDLYANQTSGGLGTTCRLVYPPRYVACDCEADPIGGKPANRPPHGPPAPFSSSQSCPVCSGSGRKALENSDEITFKLNWEPRKFVVPVPNAHLRLPYSIVETKGYLSDVPKVLKAEHLVINVPIEPIIRAKFKLMISPADSSTIVPGRYFSAVWEQFSG